jgi:hypothetical protein
MQHAWVQSLLLVASPLRPPPVVTRSAPSRLGSPPSVAAVSRVTVARPQRLDDTGIAWQGARDAVAQVLGNAVTVPSLPCRLDFRIRAVICARGFFRFQAVFLSPDREPIGETELRHLWGHHLDEELTVMTVQEVVAPTVTLEGVHAVLALVDGAQENILPLAVRLRR